MSRLTEYAPGQLAELGEIVTASDGGQWFLDYERWRRADIPLNRLGDDTTPLPPELVSRLVEPTRRRRR